MGNSNSNGNSNGNINELQQIGGPTKPSVLDNMKSGLDMVNPFKKKPVYNQTSLSYNPQPVYAQPVYSGYGGTRRRKNLKKRLRKGKSKRVKNRK